MPQSASCDDVSLMRVATAALDEAADWIGYRVGTYDEQPGEADALRRVQSAAQGLKLRLAAYVLDGLPDESGEGFQRGQHGDGRIAEPPVHPHGFAHRH
jgi:hypothetical protein